MFGGAFERGEAQLLLLRNRRQVHGKGVLFENRLHAGDLRRSDEPELLRQARGKEKPEAHRLAVQVHAVTGGILHRVRKGVPEVQERAAVVLCRLALVLLDDLRLENAAARDDLRQLRRGGRKARERFQLLKERGVRQQAVFDDLAHPGRKFAGREGGESVHVRKDREGLPEGAHEVLARGDIDARLAADGTVHHREERRRNLHKTDAAQVARRRKAREVARHAAAAGKENAVARKPALRQELAERRKLGKGLGILARGHYVARKAAEGPCDEFPLRLEKGGIHDEDRAAAFESQARQHRGNLRGQARSDGDVVTAFREVDPDCWHGRILARKGVRRQCRIAG